jgi:hypothetical protein
MKPFYKSKKFWTAIITALSMIIAYFRDPELAKMIMAVGLTLIGGFSIADHGKERTALELEAAYPADEEEEEEDSE